MPSPLIATDVTYEDLLHLPSMDLRLQVIFSFSRIRCKDYSERRVLTRWVLDYYARICGGTCHIDPTLRTCQTFHEKRVRLLSDLEFDHMPGYVKVRHVTDYKHNAKPEYRLGLLRECLNEARKCKMACWFHHHQRHTINAGQRVSPPKSILLCTGLTVLHFFKAIFIGCKLSPSSCRHEVQSPYPALPYGSTTQWLGCRAA